MLLHCHTWFSLRYGTMREQELVNWLCNNGHEIIALTDINNTSAFFNTLRMARGKDLRMIPGIDFRNGIQHRFTGIAKTANGWEVLNRYLSEHLHAKKPFPERAPDLEDVYIIYPFNRERFFALKPNEYIGIRPDDLNLLELSTWRHHRNKLVACPTCSFLSKRDFNAHRLLRAIDNNCLLSKLPKSEQGLPSDLYLSKDAILHTYKHMPDLVENALQLLHSCTFDFEFGKPRNKQVFSESPDEDLRLLEALAKNGLQYRYASVTDEISQRLEKELSIIGEKQFTAYFLISWDIVRYARSKGYFYVGRGSGANSLVAYCLGITDVDPIALDLYFERFINLYRENPPDFDMDFSWKDREDVTRYIFEKHGHKYVALLGAYNTFQYRAAVREISKVFGLPAGEIDQLISGSGPKDEIGTLILRYSKYIEEFPNYLSIHAGGILISAQPIAAYSATFMPPKGFPTVHFDMHIAEDIGLYKFDVLSQRGLGHIKDAVLYIQKNQGVDVPIREVSQYIHDEGIRDLLKTGRTMGCFYVESPAMRQLLKKMGCTDYISLVAASSIIRPGVARSGMMQEYIRRYRFPEAREEAHPVMRDIMPETFGIMVYQEDVIKVAHYFAGLTLAESDVLRRGMSGKFRSREAFQRVKDRFFSNCREKGYSETLTSEVWFQIESFAGYSFSKGHSASYAVESFQSLFLKSRYPLEFMCAVVNNFGGFYRTEFYLHEARLAGAEILPPCINQSEALCRISGKTIYLGLAFIDGLERRLLRETLLERQQNGPFRDLDDYCERMQPPLEQLKKLIRAGAFDFAGETPKALYWKAHSRAGSARLLPATPLLFKEPAPNYLLPKFDYNNLERFYDQMEVFGFSLLNPFDWVQGETNHGILADQFNKQIGKWVEAIGYLVTIKPTRTAKGDRMYFGTFIDQSGQWIDTTHFPKAIEKHPFRGRGVYRISGTVDEAYGVCTITVNKLTLLPLKPDPRHAS
jgi:error-prone DNA polymerase